MKRQVLALGAAALFAIAAQSCTDHKNDGKTPVSCSMSSTCPAATPFCGPSGACIECRTKEDCDAKHLTCDSSNQCAMCKVNSDCTSGRCNSSGMCEDRSTLLYVNNAPTANCSESGTGSFAAPFCKVQTGLNASASTGKQVVVFAGAGYAESLEASPAQNGGNDYVASAVGVGQPVIKPSTGGPLAVHGQAGNQVTLFIDGFTFDGTNATQNTTCSGDGVDFLKTTLTLLHSTITGGPKTGISSSNHCTLTLDADIISNNRGGGISVSGSDFSLTNLLVIGNGTATTTKDPGSNIGGIGIDTTSGEATKMTLANLTIVNNQKKTGSQPSGISCNSSPTFMINTVVFGNQGGAQEITIPDCNPTYSAFVGAGANNASHNDDLTTCQAADLFAAPPGDLHLKKGGTPPCTLIGLGTTSQAPTDDLDGKPRASGAGDIGCYVSP